MLSLIGLGLNDEKDITLRGLEVAKQADKVYIELYTNKWSGSLDNLKELIGKEITELLRRNLEDESEKIIEEAKNQNIVIFVLGDPLVATTHTMLLQEAKKLGIETQVIHNASIISAIGETGLHLYKFGSTVTIPFPEKTEGELPESVYELISENKKHGLHTLCLLDVVANDSKFMTANEGMKILLQLEDKFKKNVFTDDTEVVVFSCAGGKDSEMVYGKIDELCEKNFEHTPSILILPGKLHFTEKDYLNFFE